MPSTPDPHTAWLVEIQSAISMIKTFCTCVDRAAFLTDPRTSSAVAMHLLIIGEAVRRLPYAVLQEAPEVPWPLHLPILHAAVERMLAARGEADA